MKKKLILVFIFSLLPIVTTFPVFKFLPAGTLSQAQANDDYRLPSVSNAETFLELDVKYVNALYPDGNPSFAPFQAVHPDIIYTSEGWNGYKYWLSVSPFPNLIPKYEDPHIFASSDGQSWIDPGDNPVVPLVHPEEHEYSDADILLVNNTMYMYYRLNDKNGSPDYSNDDVTMYRIGSADGSNWSSPQATSISNIKPSGKFASPTVIYEDGDYYLFYVDTISQEVHRLVSSDGLYWRGDMVVLSIPSAWHMDVIKNGGSYIMLINENPQVPKARLYYYTSDDTINWTNRGILLTSSNSGWDSSRVYRSTAIIDGNRFRLWYSAFEGAIGHSGYTEDYGAVVWREDFEGDLSLWHQEGSAEDCAIEIQNIPGKVSPAGGKHLFLRVIRDGAWGCNVWRTISPHLENGRVSLWFYDNVHPDNPIQIVAAVKDDCDHRMWLGVRTLINSTNYTYRVNDSDIDTGISRSFGWHQFEFYVRDGESYGVIDGHSLEAIASSTSLTYFTGVKLLGAWGVACASRFDGVKVSQSRLEGDLDNDGDVDGSDIKILLSRYGTDDSEANLNSDGIVNGIDFGEMVKLIQ